jgi:hypothetical protein
MRFFQIPEGEVDQGDAVAGGVVTQDGELVPVAGAP